MTPAGNVLQRLRFLARVIRRECTHLAATGARLRDAPFSIERARRLDSDAELSGRVEAFAARFGRLQDKLLPLLLSALGEPAGAAIDLDRAERLGWLPSADEWLSARKLRNQMIH